MLHFRLGKLEPEVNDIYAAGQYDWLVAYSYDAGDRYARQPLDV